MFDPELEPGDRWRWIVFFGVLFALGGVARTRALIPYVYLLEGAIALVVLTLVIAGLLRLLR